MQGFISAMEWDLSDVGERLSTPGGFPMMMYGFSQEKVAEQQFWMWHAVPSHTEPPHPDASLQSWEVAVEDFVLYLVPLLRVLHANGKKTSCY